MNKNKYNRGDIVCMDNKNVIIDNYTYNNGQYEYYIHELGRWYTEYQIDNNGEFNHNEELPVTNAIELNCKPDIIYKDKVYNDEYYLTIKIPVSYIIKNNEFEKFTDEFDNEYYENSYNYNGLTEAKQQNSIIQKTIDYLHNIGWDIEQESLG